jgi:catechol 2,3-dioxygenase-like lactoylglutathione lyase family enzyme
MIDHLSLQVHDVAGCAAFYDTVLGTIGGKRILDFGQVIGYGTHRPVFWLGPIQTGTGAREVHIGFQAPSRAAVIAFHDAAIAAGAELLHPPRVWPEYHENYFGAFVRDPEGNNVEAVCHEPE